MSDYIYNVAVSISGVLLIGSVFFAIVYFHPRTRDATRGLLTAVALLGWLLGGLVALLLLAFGLRARRGEGAAPPPVQKRTLDESADLSKAAEDADFATQEASAAVERRDSAALLEQENRLRLRAGLIPIHSKPPPSKPPPGGTP